MAEPTCRICYALTLPDDERERFFTGHITMPVYYCPEHQAVVDKMEAAAFRLGLLEKSSVVTMGTITGRMPRPPQPQFARSGGTPHDHTTYVEGCFRCALSRDERAVSGEEPYDVLYSIEVIDGEMVSTGHYLPSILEAAYAEKESREHHG